jgi:hypothetical protein
VLTVVGLLLLYARVLIRFGRTLLFLLLLVWTARFVTARSPDAVMNAFLHRVDLVFHEAGHVVFSPFGHFTTMLGGSLFQLMVPVVCAVALYRSTDRFGAVVATWWFGQNFVDLAPYIGDARALQLPLLGGRTGAEVEGHDWEAILQSLGWLQHDRTLATAAHAAGSIMMVGCLAVAALMLLQGQPARRSVPGHGRPSIGGRSDTVGRREDP